MTAMDVRYNAGTPEIVIRANRTPLEVLEEFRVYAERQLLSNRKTPYSRLLLSEEHIAPSENKRLYRLGISPEDNQFYATYKTDFMPAHEPVLIVAQTNLGSDILKRFSDSKKYTVRHE